MLFPGVKVNENILNFTMYSICHKVFDLCNYNGYIYFREWMMERSFKTTMTIYNPQVIFFLGIYHSFTHILFFLKTNSSDYMYR